MRMTLTTSHATRVWWLALVAAAALSACSVPELQPAVAPVVAQKLVGVQWEAVTFNHAQPVQAPRPQLRWTTPQLVVGVGGCNNFFGSVEMAGDNLRFGPLAATGKACMTAPSGQEDLFFKALESTRKARMERGQLVLLDENGMVLMRLTTATKQP